MGAGPPAPTSVTSIRIAKPQQQALSNTVLRPLRGLFKEPKGERRLGSLHSQKEQGQTQTNTYNFIKKTLSPYVLIS